MFIVWLILLGIIYFLTPMSVQAAELPMNLSEWQVLESSRFDDPSKTCLERDGPTHWEERDGGLGVLINESLPCQTVIAPKDPQYFGTRRFALNFTMKIDDAGHDHNILVLWKDRDNFSDFHLIGQNIEYEKIVGGKAVYSVSTRLALGPQSTHSYRVEHDESTGVTKLWRDNKPIFTVIEPDDIPELPSAWIGLRASVGQQRTSDVTFSQFRFENLGRTFTTTVPLFKQNDPRWKDLEYDHAQSWSSEKPTIARWGCALTSAVMVLHSYGIKQFPDGTALLPDALNSWLLTQKDGYFAEGHLNWRALTRLVKQIAEVHGTTKLEFTYELPVDALGWLTQTLESGRPIILDLGGHFVVSHQAGAGEYDFLIHDPLYPFVKLKDYKNLYLSARLFTPSQTDLSAITVVAPLSTSLQFFDKNNSPLMATKILLPPLEGDNHEALQLYDLPKPPLENVQIRVQSSDALTVPLTVFTYNSIGQGKKSDILLDIQSSDGKDIILPWSQETNVRTLELPSQANLGELRLYSTKTPFLFSWLTSWKTELESIPTLELAQKWLAGCIWMIERAWRNTWISQTERLALFLLLEQSVREKFP
jgi:hypothetical protein